MTTKPVDPYYYEDESADLAAEMDADRRAEYESEMGPPDEPDGSAWTDYYPSSRAADSS